MINEDYIKLSKIILATVSKLTNDEIQNLLDKKAVLIYQEKLAQPKIERNNLSNKVLDENIKRITTLGTKELVVEYLNKFKKPDLVQLANYLNIKVLSKDNKNTISQKIYDLLIGVKLRQQLFDDIHNKK